MKISIITVVFNNVDFIEDAIRSVLFQVYPSVELIIIDGGSTDGTLGIINKFKAEIDMLISEPDGGLYDAMNKGVSIATGDVIGFLHSDDIYADTDILSSVANTFIANSSIDAVYGDLKYVARNDVGKIIRYWESCDFNLELVKKGWMPPHPTLFVQRKVFETLIGFDTSYSISSDYEFIIRLFWLYETKSCYLNKTFVYMRWGGESNRNFRNMIKKSLEDLRVIRQHNVGSVGVLLMKNFSKLSQFMK